MRKWILQLLLGVVMGIGGLTFCPAPAAASFAPATPMIQVKPAPAPVKPVARDFADSEFAAADQPELGTQTGGVVVIIGGLIVLVAIILLIVLLFAVLT